MFYFQHVVRNEWAAVWKQILAMKRWLDTQDSDLSLWWEQTDWFFPKGHGASKDSGCLGTRAEISFSPCRLYSQCACQTVLGKSLRTLTVRCGIYGSLNWILFLKAHMLRKQSVHMYVGGLLCALLKQYLPQTLLSLIQSPTLCPCGRS